MARSSIEWTEATWNPVAGCSIISSGCTNCYAMRMASRLEAMGQPKYRNLTRKTGGRSKWNGKINLDSSSLSLPMKWGSGRLVFVNSMSDLFHEEVPTSFVHAVFDTMRKTPQHTYQVLTKRAGRLSDLPSELFWPENVWMGVSVETQEFCSRVDHLRNCSAKVKFLSLEPLLGPLNDLDLTGIDWVIAGGESGPGARPMEERWIIDIRDRCKAEGVAFHFKQWGGTNKKAAGRMLEGRTWDELPKSFRREHTRLNVDDYDHSGSVW